MTFYIYMYDFIDRSNLDSDYIQGYFLRLSGTDQYKVLQAIAGF